MALYEVTFGNGRLVDTDDIGDSVYMEALQRKLHPTTYRRLVKTAEDAVENLVQSSFGKLTWTKAGALFGHSSLEPKKHVDHLWEAVISAVGDDKNCLKTVGTLLLWTISKRKEKHWLLYREDTGEVDDVTGKPITVCTYWIDPKYKPETKGYTAADLCAKFNKNNHT